MNKLFKTLAFVSVLTFSPIMGMRGASLSDIVINEIMSANIDSRIDPSWNYGGFIELYNPTDAAISLTGIWLSDDINNLKKWQLRSSVSLKSKGYYLIWFDHYDEYYPTQCSFDLDSDGGVLYLSDRSGKLQITQDYPAAKKRCSYARTTDGGDTWGWCAEPSISTTSKTMGATNNGSKFASVQLDAPEVDKIGQIFSGTMQVTVKIPQGATLRYTTNGSVPTLTNGTTSSTGLFSVSKSTVYRFRLFRDGYLPSDVVTRSYIYNDKNFCVPVISVVTDDKNLNGQEYGIFVQGSGNGRPGRGQNGKCNWNMDWDRPVSFEYIEDGKEVCFAQEVNMAMCGGWSRAWTPHSFKLKASKVYGLKYMPYSFFPDKPYVKTKTLQIRNGGNGASDNNYKLTDAILQGIVARSGIDVDYQSYKPSFVYINGKFYGVLNIREANNKHLAYSNRGLDNDELDQFEIDPDSNYVQMEGTKEAFDELYNLSKTASQADSYSKIRNLLDIDEFINYMAIELYLGGDDWPHNNVKAYRPRMENGKFRFVLFDLDFAFHRSSNAFTAFAGEQKYTFNVQMGKYAGKQLANSEIEFITIFLNLLNNEQFRKQFIDRFCLIAGSVFEPSRCEEIVTEIADYADTAFNQVTRSDWRGTSTESCWESAYNVLNNLTESRQSTMITALKNFSRMKLAGKVPIKATLKSNIDDARILVNDQAVPTNSFNGQLFGPVTVRTEAPAGYRFVGWVKGTKTQQANAFGNGSKWSYYDKGSLDGKQWNKSTFTGSWADGTAPIGYKTGSTWAGTNVKTTVAEKKVTYYFRKEFNLDFTPTEDNNFTLSFLADDGCVVYVNGTEAGRFNMPSGTVNYNTYASQYCDDFQFPQTMPIPASLLKRGDNLIAVEVHNNDATSSDALWDASLNYTAFLPGDIKSTEQAFVLPATGTMEYTAFWEKLQDEELLKDNAVPVRINEVSAGNSIYVNEYFDKEDWIELYNMTGKSVDLAGMYLSDNVNKPKKFQFVKGDVSTVIEPYGYRVIWCDKNDGTSQLHTSFKLGNEQAFAVLTASDETWADTLQYCPHNGDQTVGRYPDGANCVYAMSVPTIGKSNMLSSYDTVHVQLTQDEIALDIDAPTIITRDGAMSMAYINGYIVAKSEIRHDAQLTLFNMAGQKVGSARLSLADGTDSYMVTLPNGTYIAKAKDVDGHECVIKFVVQ